MLSDQHQRLIVRLNASGIQQENPPLYDAISGILTILEPIDEGPLLDNGISAVNAADANGTRVNFNVSFNTITAGSNVSVVANVLGAVPGFVHIYAITNTYFTAAAFDATGTQLDAHISWVAHGSN